jgi:hypothetical protein
MYVSGGGYVLVAPILEVKYSLVIDPNHNIVQRIPFRFWSIRVAAYRYAHNAKEMQYIVTSKQRESLTPVRDNG